MREPRLSMDNSLSSRSTVSSWGGGRGSSMDLTYRDYLIELPVDCVMADIGWLFLHLDEDHTRANTRSTEAGFCPVNSTFGGKNGSYRNIHTRPFQESIPYGMQISYDRNT